MKTMECYRQLTVVQLRVQCTILTYFPILRLLSRHQLPFERTSCHIKKIVA